ncbi:hypothetical protein SAMN05518871_1017 [Psychrobacillus sp. OK028]|uniref:hypothetical protein n=1 Tax=Psychrobacillus sp. OK028 TaxID=1884359 RepID=UPI00088DCAF3|nr:hypothetical protein [Psychrobacillus sp. OK028]SDM34953.1 hypothetical protein SAMN05518871_1017 [Psychrobacillus sp. OK028]
MYKYEGQRVGRVELLRVKEGALERLPAKRVNIVSLKVVKETSFLYKDRHVRSPRDSYEIIRTFLEDADREMFVAMAWFLHKVTC